MRVISKKKDMRETNTQLSPPGHINIFCTDSNFSVKLYLVIESLYRETTRKKSEVGIFIFMNICKKVLYVHL
jgi:hypothetical protein